VVPLISRPSSFMRRAYSVDGSACQPCARAAAA
jgi:hypothetical protein